MLARRRFPPLPENDHGTANRSALLRAPLPVVRAPPPADLGPRPALHLPLRASARKRTGNLLESVDGVPPSDRRAVRAEEPVGRTVPQTLIDQSARLGRDAPSGHANQQKHPKLNHR